MKKSKKLKKEKKKKIDAKIEYFISITLMNCFSLKIILIIIMKVRSLRAGGSDEFQIMVLHLLLIPEMRVSLTFTDRWKHLAAYDSACFFIGTQKDIKTL